jgi:hypothetical protein
MSKKDIDVIKKVSPSATSSYSPWVTMPVKMVKTKVVKEMAKELFTLFSSKVNYILAQAINNDENSISRIDNKGNIKNDNIIYSNDYEVQNEDDIETTKEVSMNEL